MMGGMSRALAHLAGTISMLLTTLLWLCMLDAGRADASRITLPGSEMNTESFLVRDCWR